MNNTAYIATNLNKAFIFDNNNTEIIEGNTGISQLLDGYLFSQIKALNSEIKEVIYNDIQDLTTVISAEYEKQEVLNMSLEVMDTSLSEEYRIGIAEILDKEISNHPELLSFVKNRLHSTSLPELFDTTFIFSKTNDFSKEFINLYSDIKEKARLFNCFYTQLRLSLNLEVSEQELADSRLTDNGSYAAFTDALYEYSQKKYNDAVIKAIPILEELHFFTNKQLFSDIQNKLLDNYQIKMEEHKFSDISTKQFNPSDTTDPIMQLIEKYIDEKQSKHDKKRGKRGMARRVKDYDNDMNSTVAEMKDWLVKNSYDSTMFFKQFESVADKQLRSGHPEHLCKTCCDLAGIFIEKSQFAISERLLNYAELLNPKDKYVYTQKAALFQQQNKPQEALKQYEEAIKKFSEDAVGYNGRAEVLRDLGRPEEALKQYDEAIKKFSANAVGYNGRAEVLRDLGRPEEALKQYEEAIKKFSENAIGYNGRAEVLRDLSRSEEALKQYDEAIKKFSEDAVGYNGRAEVLRDWGRPEEALKQYDEAIKKFSENAVGYNGRAEVLRDLGRPEEALKQYDESIKKFSEDAFGYTGRAEVLRDLGRPEEALKQYDEAIKKFSEDAVGYSGRAEVLRDLGRPEEALKQYDESIKKFSENAFGYTGRAEVLRDLGRPEEALKQYEEAIKKFSEDAVGYNGRAEVLRDLGRPEEALKQYDESIKKFSEDAFGYTGTAEVLRDLGRPEEALKQYDESIKKFSENAVGYNGRAEVLRDLGRSEEALKQYEEVIKLFPFDEVSKRGRIQLLLEKDKYEEFNKLIKKENYITSGDYIELHMYCIYLIKIGDWEQARKKIDVGLNSPFLNDTKYFKNTDAYLNILKKQFGKALEELNSIKIHTPAQSLLVIHANAENNNKPKAVEELHKLETIKRPVIFNTLNYLSERYSLNGFKKTNKPKEELDKLILEGEMKALLQY